MTVCVLDASVALAWAFKDEASPYAVSAIRRLKDGRAAGPVVWSLEVSNALIVAVRQGRIVEMLSHRLHRAIHRLPVETDGELPIAVLGHGVLRIGIDQGLSAHDASDLESAIRRGLPLATQDERLARAAEAAGVEVLPP